MTIEQFTRVFDGLTRAVVAIAIAFLAWLALGQPSECPSCGNPLDKHQTYVRAQTIGERPNSVEN